MRLRFGIALLLASAASALFWAVPTGGGLAWAVTIGLLAAGAFGVFEARKGWCAVRALGFKTPV